MILENKAQFVCLIPFPVQLFTPMIIVQKKRGFTFFAA